MRMKISGLVSSLLNVSPSLAVLLSITHGHQNKYNSE